MEAPARSPERPELETARFYTENGRRIMDTSHAAVERRRIAQHRDPAQEPLP